MNTATNMPIRISAPVAPAPAPAPTSTIVIPPTGHRFFGDAPRRTTTLKSGINKDRVLSLREFRKEGKLSNQDAKRLHRQYLKAVNATMQQNLRKEGYALKSVRPSKSDKTVTVIYSR